MAKVSRVDSSAEHCTGSTVRYSSRIGIRRIPLFFGCFDSRIWCDNLCEKSDRGWLGFGSSVDLEITGGAAQDAISTTIGTLRSTVGSTTLGKGGRIAEDRRQGLFLDGLYLRSSLDQVIARNLDHFRREQGCEDSRLDGSRQMEACSREHQPSRLDIAWNTTQQHP